MVTHITTYPSLLAMVDTVDKSRVNGHWIEYQSNASLSEIWDPQTGTLEEAVTRARTLEGLEESIARMTALSETLSTTSAQPESLKRVRTRGRSGVSVNVHAVNRGDMAHAWKRMVRRRTAGGDDIILVVPATWSWRIPSSQVEWSLIASAAYAQSLARAGYRVSLYASHQALQCFHNGDNNITIVALQSAGTVAHTLELAIVAHPSFARRLHFRLPEIISRPYQGMVENYGIPMDAIRLRQELDPWLHEQGLSPEALVLGATQDDNILNEARARAWIAQQGHTHALP